MFLACVLSEGVCVGVNFQSILQTNSKELSVFVCGCGCGSYLGTGGFKFLTLPVLSTILCSELFIKRSRCVGVSVSVCVGERKGGREGGTCDECVIKP